MMRTLSKELPEFCYNLWKMKDLVQLTISEILAYVDSEETLDE
ncbi:3220_t:CDS:2 [Entrophospora sp. SA101]|nr:3220_t:CDS:2 [Entrophospora sp. SA101]